MAHGSKRRLLYAASDVDLSSLFRPIFLSPCGGFLSLSFSLLKGPCYLRPLYSKQFYSAKIFEKKGNSRVYTQDIPDRIARRQNGINIFLMRSPYCNFPAIQSSFFKFQVIRVHVSLCTCMEWRDSNSQPLFCMPVWCASVLRYNIYLLSFFSLFLCVFLSLFLSLRCHCVLTLAHFTVCFTVQCTPTSMLSIFSLYPHSKPACSSTSS